MKYLLTTLPFVLASAFTMQQNITKEAPLYFSHWNTWEEETPGFTKEFFAIPDSDQSPIGVIKLVTMSSTEGPYTSMRVFSPLTRKELIKQFPTLKDHSFICEVSKGTLLSPKTADEFSSFLKAFYDENLLLDNLVEELLGKLKEYGKPIKDFRKEETTPKSYPLEMSPRKSTPEGRVNRIRKMFEGKDK